MNVSPKPTSSISTNRPASCADWTSNGEWRTPFNPRASTHRSDDYCEGTAWQWTWFVPHDVEGLVKLMGGEEAFVEKLDSLFTVDSSLDGETTSADISGLIGQYAHGNEPSHHSDSSVQLCESSVENAGISGQCLPEPVCQQRRRVVRQ